MLYIVNVVYGVVMVYKYLTLCTEWKKRRRKKVGQWYACTNMGGIMIFFYWSQITKSSLPLARLSFVETCGPCWQRAKFGRIPRKRLQVLAYGRTNSSSFSASGLCHLHGLKKRHDGCLAAHTGLRPGNVDVRQEYNMTLLCSKANKTCLLTFSANINRKANVFIQAYIDINFVFFND